MTIISVNGAKLLDFTFLLGNALEKFGGALILSESKTVQDFLYEPEFVIHHTDIRPVSNTSREIIIENSGEDGLLFTVNTDEQAALNLKVGLHHSDDITVSSIANQNICVSVLTPVKTMSEQEILPCEIKINNIDNIDILVILAVISILLLTDKLDKNQTDI